MTDPAEPASLKRATRVRSMDPQFEADLGARIRAARVAAGLSQTALGAALGVSFQQVQKYEAGRDRIAVSTLRAIAAVLRVPLTLLIEIDTPVPASDDAKLLRAAMAVAAGWQRISDPNVRRRIAALVAAVAEGEPPTDDGEA